MRNLSCENEFYLHENEKWFPYQRLSTYPRFETEARGNSVMAYFFVKLAAILKYEKLSLRTWWQRQVAVRPPKVFFGLSRLSISNLETNPTAPKIWRFEKAWEISCQLVRAWDRSWNRETQSRETWQVCICLWITFSPADSKLDL